MTDALPQGATIGILGGGQLGRMLSVAASRLGYRCHIYEPGAAPAGDVALTVTTAPYEDEAALRDNYVAGLRRRGYRARGYPNRTAALAALVPWADDGMRHTSRSWSPRERW